MQGWAAGNRERIDRLIGERGVGSAGFDPSRKPVAVFDWDNTMMKNDIGDATFFWMLRHDRVLQPQNRDWSRTNQHLTAAAREALNSACDSVADPGQPLRTSSSAACADVLVSIYDRSATPKGAVAFDSETTTTMHQPYAWGSQLHAGYTLDEVRAFARQAYSENADAPIGATQTIGTTTGLTAWVRIYEPMHDLVGTLQANGFDVWIVSASAQGLAEVVGAKVGVDASHVVGVRAVLRSDGRLDHRLRACGPEPDGTDDIITYDQGKRCWINRAIFQLAPADQLARAADPRMRPVFAAGDSDTDLAMVQDATVLKLAINRNRPLLMCNAYSGARDRWLVQPMFIAALPQRAIPYPCAGALDHAGKPATDEDGKPMTDKSEF